MSEQDYEQLTLFPEGSPVSHFPWLESKKERGTTVISGQRCSWVAVQEGQRLWPTPKATDYKGSGPRGSKAAEHDLKHGNLKGAAMYATPCAGDAQGTSGGNNGRSLRTDVCGQLNPEWVEWLMGFPAGWTE